MLSMHIRIVQRDKVDALDRTMMLARPKITDKCQILAVWLVQHTVIDTQRATLQIQERRRLLVQILAVIVLPLQKAVGTIVGDAHDFRYTTTTALFGFAQ